MIDDIETRALSRATALGEPFDEEDVRLVIAACVGYLADHHITPGIQNSYSLIDPAVSKTQALFVVIAAYLLLCAKLQSPVLRAVGDSRNEHGRSVSWHLARLVSISQSDMPGSSAPSFWASLMAATGDDLRSTFAGIADAIVEFEASHGQA